MYPGLLDIDMLLALLKTFLLSTLMIGFGECLGEVGLLVITGATTSSSITGFFITVIGGGLPKVFMQKL